MKENKLISIILPVYNGEAFLGLAIESILEQSYSNFELIIVNDCSTDSSIYIAEKYAQLDDRISIIHNVENKKLPASLNIGHRASKGTYATWTSDDNILKPTFLERLMNELEIGQADLVYSNYDIIQNDGSLKRKHKAGPTEQLLFGNVLGASFMYRRVIFESLEGYNEQLFLLEDFDFWLRASRKFSFVYLDDNLYQYRLHAKSLTAGIRVDKGYNEKHDKGVDLMFSNLAKTCLWQQETISLLTKHFKRESIDVENYLSKKELIKNDLFCFNPLHLKSELIFGGLLKVLRYRLVSEVKYKKIRILLLVLKEEPALLFHKSFSRKVTLKYIKDCIL